MATVASVGDAVARIAYLSSDVVLSIRPALSLDSEFSASLRQLTENQVPGVWTKNPEVISIRHNADPFLSAFAPLRLGKAVSITTSSLTLLPSLPHLYKLAQYPIAIHVSLRSHGQADFTHISSIRQCGFLFLQSETLREGQDMALSAQALATKSGKGVIHFFDPKNSEDDDPISAEDRYLVKKILSAAQTNAAHAPLLNETSLYVDDGRTPTVLETSHSQTYGNVQRTPVEPVNSPSPSQRNLPNDGSSRGSSARGSSADGRPSESSATSAESVTTRPVSSDDIYQWITSIWAQIGDATGRRYTTFEYTGPSDADAALFIFGSTGVFVDEILKASSVDEFVRCGIITARLYRPWLGSKMLTSIPRSVRKIAVLEQIRRKTTKWGPVLLDVLTSLNAGPCGRARPTIVGHQLGVISPVTARQALRGIFQNLKSPSPIQNLEIGGQQPPSKPDQYAPRQPKLEDAYTKILNQVFGQKLHVANRMHAKDVGISSSLQTNPEYGLGALLARRDHRKRFVQEVRAAATSSDFITSAPQRWLSQWLLAGSDPTRTNRLAPEVISRLMIDGSPIANHLLESRSLFFLESDWLVGSDAWAYDLGNSGVHHMLASGANINMLIIESQPYSERAADDKARRKKDIGLYAMNFGNAYVASVAVYSSYTQVLEAMIEADRFDGPSVVVAYLPYHKEDDSPLTVLQESKRAVDLGYWPLYRWNPHNEEKGEPSFQLDSERIKQELEEFLRRDNHLTQLTNREPEFSTGLSDSYGTEVRLIQKRRAKDAYETLVESLLGAPVTVLFASDNGNAESLAKRLGNRGRARGLKTKVFAMDDFPVEDLPGEENVVMVTSTAGQGEFPQNGRAFWDSIKDNTELDLSQLKYTVFALGDSHYWPRKEDRRYYNKPGKDLDTRISFLGGKKLVDIGLGDDQDPDAYHTGYNEWEPKLWASLNVDKVEGLPEEPPPLTNEDIKIASNYLRGTIAEGLKDTSTGAIAASDQQLTKFHGTYMQDDRDLRDERKAQGLEPAYSFMIRCRLNGGVATTSQWLQMDAIASAYGNETMKMTTRQTFQFHGVIKRKLKPAMRSINQALMTTIAACGDVNRNVMCSVLPTQSAYHYDVHQVSARISDHLLPSTTAYHEIWLKEDDGKETKVAGDALIDHEPLYGPTYLPRKFKITIAVPPNNDTDVYAHDVGLIAIKGSNDRLEGFNVLIGGGMGVTHNMKKTYPRTGSMLGYMPSDKIPVVCEKIMLVQRDNGDRKNRKHARLKYTVDDMGVDIYRSKVEELLGHKFEPARHFEFKSNIDIFGWQKDENNMNHFTFFIENGRVEDMADFPMRTGLREIAKVHKGEFRLTGNQHLCLSGVHDKDLENIKNLMKKYKLDNVQFSGLRLSSSACVAFPTCGLAMAESERYLPELVTKLESSLEENGLRQESIVMRMTGCPNGCARPWLAEVAFVGKAYGAYNMYLGGGYHGQRLNKLYRSSIQEAEILDIMKPMLKRYALERHEGEHFGDWTIRACIIKETTEGRTFHDDIAEEESEDEA